MNQCLKKKSAARRGKFVVCIILLFAGLILQLAKATETADTETKADLSKIRSIFRSDIGKDKDFPLIYSKLSPRLPLVPVAEGESTNRFFKVRLNHLGAAMDGIRFKVSPGEDRKFIGIFASSKKNPVVSWMVTDSQGVLPGYYRVYRSEGSDPDDTYFGSAYDLLLPWGKEAKDKNTVIFRIDARGTSSELPIKAGKEYVMWFKFKDDTATELQAAITLVPAKTELMQTWEIEQALNLFED